MSIPAHVSVSRAVARSEQYSGELAGDQLQRMAEFAPVHLVARFEFGTGTAGQGHLLGHVEGELQLDCQVCNAHYTWPLDVSVDLVIVTSEDEESRLMRDFDPLLVLDDQVKLREVVEDEVLLAVPLMRRCPACENRAPGEVELDDESSSKPLAALKNLKLKS